MCDRWIVINIEPLQQLEFDFSKQPDTRQILLVVVVFFFFCIKLFPLRISKHLLEISFYFF